MNRTIALFFGLLAALGIYAETVSEQQARQIAQRHDALAPAMLLAYQMQTVPDEAPELYVYNRSDGQGWVVVAGDDRATAAVLAYSHSGSFHYDAAPEVTKSILATYAEGIRLLRQTGTADRPATSRRRAEGATSVGPLLKTQWDQGTPYNDLCPLGTDGTTHCWTGCVATAFAQIMNYWQWPRQGAAQHTNAEHTGETAVFAETVYDWDNMADSYADGQYTEAQARAVARLMADVGTGSDMRYSTGSGMSGSSTFPFNAYKALFKYFGYGYDMQIYTLNSHFYQPSNISWAEVSGILRDELQAGRPVYATIEDRLDPTFSHAVVCDGYENTDYFHFNFGWSGQTDGFYLPDALDGHYFVTELITRIHPAAHVSLYKDDVIYTFLDNGEAIVTGAEPATAVRIQSEVEQDGITFPVTQLWKWAFSGSGVTEVNIPGSIRQIPDSAFFNCPQLTSVWLGSGVERIGNEAFRHCGRLTAATFPASLRYIGDSSFGGCDLSYFSTQATDYVIGAGAFYQNRNMKAAYGLENASEIRTIAFAFTDLRGDVTISPHCHYEPGAVSGKFDHIYLPADVTAFDVSSVTGTSAYVVDPDNPSYSSLGGLLLDKAQKTLLKCPAYENTGDQLAGRGTVVVPVGIETLRPLSFGSSLYYVTLPATVQQMDSAFTYCDVLREVTLLSVTPPTVSAADTFHESVHAYGRSVLKVPHGSKAAYEAAPVWRDFNSIKDDTYVIGQYCFEKAMAHDYATDTDYPYATLTGRYATASFDGNATDIPDAVTIDGDRCPVTAIRYMAFMGDPQLLHVVIPDNVSDLGYDAFRACTHLQTVTIGRQLTDLGYYTYQGRYNPFSDCPQLAAILVAEGNEAFFSADGMLFGYDRYMDDARTLFLCPPMLLADGQVVTRSKVTVPAVAQRIAVGAFAETLRSVTIPASVTSIATGYGSGAFLACRNLETVTNLATTPQDINYDTFYSDIFNDWEHEPATLHVPAGTKSLYEAASRWQDFKRIVEIDPSGIRQIVNSQSVNRQYYDLQGRRVSRPARGLYITGGRKVVVR